jgi:hypothetical protein
LRGDFFLATSAWYPAKLRDKWRDSFYLPGQRSCGFVKENFLTMPNKTAAFYRGLSALAKSPITKAVAGAGVGTGAAALENIYTERHGLLSDPLRHINLGLGGLTGAGGGIGGRKGMAAALLSIPLKQMGLFTVDALDKLRMQQKDLMDTQLERAKTDLSTAEIGAATERIREKIISAATNRENRRDALGGLMALGLLTGGLGVAAYAKDNKKYTDWHEQREKDKEDRRKKRESSALKATKGRSPRGVPKFDLRLKVPAESMPADVLKSLMDLDESRGAKTTYSLT